MATKRTQRDAARVIRGGIAALAMAVAAPAAAQQASPDERARLTEQQMTDDERFSLLISILGNVEGGAFPPDPRIPSDLKNPSAGYTPESWMTMLSGFTGRLPPHLRDARVSPA